MKTWKHINFEQRKIISSGISNDFKLKDIALALNLDPTSISKEVKRNRIVVSAGNSKTICKHLNRWPYVCSRCPKRYTSCYYTKFKYDAKIAQKQADFNLINSRRGLDIEKTDFSALDKLIKEGIDNKKSVYQIKFENSDVIKQSISTIYRYINNGYLTTKRLDLPYAVKFKKRKKNKKYDYSNNKIDRTNHTFLDYLAYLHKNPGIYVWQLDFLGAIKSDNKAILTFILPPLQLPIINIVTNPNSTKVVKFFDDIENAIGIDAFKELIPVILTDRDPCFSDIDGICFSKITGEERCKIFFCDPYVSSQKPNVENINKQLRLFFPKGKSIDKHNKDSIKNINLSLLNRPLRSLDGNTPKDAFVNVFDEYLFNKLF